MTDFSKHPAFRELPPEHIARLNNIVGETGDKKMVMVPRIYDLEQEVERLREAIQHTIRQLEDEKFGASREVLAHLLTLALPIGHDLSDEDWKHIASTRLMNDPEERRAADEAYDKSKSSVNGSEKDV